MNASWGGLRRFREVFTEYHSFCNSKSLNIHQLEDVALIGNILWSFFFGGRKWSTECRDDPIGR
jgi:hypothetical protein